MTDRFERYELLLNIMKVDNSEWDVAGLMQDYIRIHIDEILKERGVPQDRNDFLCWIRRKVSFLIGWSKLHKQIADEAKKRAEQDLCDWALTRRRMSQIILGLDNETYDDIKKVTALYESYRILQRR